MPVDLRGYRDGAVSEDVAHVLQRNASCGEQAGCGVAEEVRVDVPEACRFRDVANRPADVRGVQRSTDFGCEHQVEIVGPLIPGNLSVDTLTFAAAQTGLTWEV